MESSSNTLTKTPHTPEKDGDQDARVITSHA